jgi:hypothetical protein
MGSNISFKNYNPKNQKDQIDKPLIIYVNGYWNKDLAYAGSETGEKYWGSSFRTEAKNYFGIDSRELFINGAGKGTSNGEERFESGKKIANERINNNQSNFYKQIVEKKRKIMIVSHSMGAAYSEGILSVLVSSGIIVNKVVHFSPADNSDFSIKLPNKTLQIDIFYDPVLMYKNLDDKDTIKGVTKWGKVNNPHNDKFGHMYTKESGFVWKWAEDLEKISLHFLRTETKYVRTPSDGLGPAMTQKIKLNIYGTNELKNKTNFLKLFTSGKYYNNHSRGEYQG